MTAQMAKQLSTILQELRLTTVRQTYEELAELARREAMSFEEYLLTLAKEEYAAREQRRTARLLGESRLPLEKSMVAFDRTRLPTKVNYQVSALLDGSFLERSENLLVFGTPGSGKTHLVCAIAQELIGQGRRVLFKPTNILVQELLVAKRDLKLPRYLKRLRKYEALILDDLGYIQQDRPEMEVLFSLLADRYERRSVMLTSNLPFSQWERIFKDPMTTAAAIDRLVHHSIVLELNLPSYRLEESKKKKSRPQEVTRAAAPMG